MKKKGILFISLGALLIISTITLNFIGDYLYERDHLSYWNLSVKASTIEQKARYLDLFVESFKNKGFDGEYNAFFLKTPDNSFDKNYEALVSLKVRLDEIQHMDIASFQYQTAIQQITQQEQGEASTMLDVFSGIWFKLHSPMLWDWIAFSLILLSLAFIFVGLIKIGGGWKKIISQMKEMEALDRKR